MEEIEEFYQETMMKDLEAAVALQYAMSIPVSAEGSGLFQMKTSATHQTQYFVLTISKISKIHEIPKISYSLANQEILMTNIIIELMKPEL